MSLRKTGRTGFVNRATKRCLISIASAACVWLAPAPGVGAQGVDKDKVLKVKAAYLYNFAKFVQWPEDRFADDKTPITIGVLGHDPFGSILDKTIKGKKVNGRRLVIKRFQARGGKNTEALRRCHILYISPTERRHLADILWDLDGSDVLVVGEGTDFAPAGGMIGLVLEEQRIAFQVNREAVAKSRIKISAKLLRLAKIVRTRTQDR